MSALELQSRARNLLLFMPNLLILCARLMTDPRVPAREKALVAGAIAYAIMPFDLIPDMLPFIGQVDDAYLIALTLLRLMSVTEPDVVRRHWRGGGDIVELIGSTALIASKLLPKRVRRVLTARVEAPSADSRVMKGEFGRLLVERPETTARTSNTKPARTTPH